jgi:hypothetical protein
MLFTALHDDSRDFADFIERQIAMGLDPYVQLPPRPPRLRNDYIDLWGIPVSYDPRVEIREWTQREAGEDYPIMYKQYITPAGTLTAEVRQTEDWRWGSHVPFLDDYLSPRSRKFIVTSPQDLPALRYLLVALSASEREQFLADSRPAIELAREHDLLLAGGWGVGADMLGWIFGFENMMLAMYDQPHFVAEMLDIIAEWNCSRMAVALGAGIDLFIRRAWYESLNFFTPSLWRQFIYPIVKADVELAHAMGAKFGYVISSSAMPLLDMFLELGIDTVIGVDPREWDLQETKRKLGGKVCIWGGLNGHLTVEQGSEEEVRQAVRDAMRICAPSGGFVLSPVDNVSAHTAVSASNTQVLIDEWRKLTGQA